MSKLFKIPVTWEMYGVIEVEAETVEEAINKFDEDPDIYELPEEKEYVDGSFYRETDDMIILMNKII